VYEGEPIKVELHDGENVVVSGSVSVINREMTPGAIIKSSPKELGKHLGELSKLADVDLKGPTLVEEYARFSRERGVEKQTDIICYGCSEKPHALKLRNRMTNVGDLWTRWQTEPEHIDAPEQLATSVITAALDCSNLWVLSAREPEISLRMRLEDNKLWITGTHSVHFLRVPDIDGDYRVITRYLRTEGRKGFTMTALLDREGTAYAVGEAVSILVDVPPEMQIR
jgi:hypothetical protein